MNLALFSNEMKLLLIHSEHYENKDGGFSFGDSGQSRSLVLEALDFQNYSIAI